jgi:hypothetical protein
MTVRAMIDRAVIVRTAENSALAGLRRALDRTALVVVDPTGRAGEAHLVEIATGRERAERTIPPDRWMDRSNCRRHVQRKKRGAFAPRPSRHHRAEKGASL